MEEDEVKTLAENHWKYVESICHKMYVDAFIHGYKHDKNNSDTNKDINQQKPESSKERKYHCNNPSCKKEITKDVVAFCLHEDNQHRFQGKVYCRECQKEES